MLFERAPDKRPGSNGASLRPASAVAMERSTSLETTAAVVVLVLVVVVKGSGAALEEIAASKLIRQGVRTVAVVQGGLLLLLDWEENWLHLLRRYLGQHHDLSSQSIQSGLKGGR